MTSAKSGISHSLSQSCHTELYLIIVPQHPCHAHQHSSALSGVQYRCPALSHVCSHYPALFFVWYRYPAQFHIAITVRHSLNVVLTISHCRNPNSLNITLIIQKGSSVGYGYHHTTYMIQTSIISFKIKILYKNLFPCVQSRGSRRVESQGPAAADAGVASIPRYTMQHYKPFSQVICCVKVAWMVLSDGGGCFLVVGLVEVELWRWMCNLPANLNTHQDS